MAGDTEKTNGAARKKKGMSRSTKTWLTIVLVLMVAAGAFVIYRVRTNANAATTYQTTTLARGNLNATIGATGNVRANQTTIISWQTSGTVDGVDVVVGDQVNVGDVLASLSTTSLAQNVVLAQADLVIALQNLDSVLHSSTQHAQAQLNLANAQKSVNSATNTLNGLTSTHQGGTSADIDYARAQVTLAQQTYDNALANYNNVKDRPDTDTFKAQLFTSLYNAQQALLRAQGNLNYYLLVPSGSDIDVARGKLALAQAQLGDAQSEWNRLKNGPDPKDVAAAQARVDAAQATINYSRLAAPFAGTVTEVHPMVGDQVSAGAAGFRVDDLSRMLVDVQVSEVDINSVALNQPAVVTFDAVLGKEYHGKVVDVSRVGTSVQSVVNFSVTVELTDPDADVKPGMTASVTITIQSLQNVLLVPNQGVHLVNSQRVVYILRAGKLVEVPVTLGASDDTMSVLVSGDLNAGDTLVLNPPLNFRPGQGGGGRGIFGGG